MKVLVTGADGFIGSHLCESLVKNGYEVTALVQYNSMGSWGWLDSSDLKNEMKVVLGDIRDPFLCHEVSKGVDAILHLAALIAIPYSYIAPQSYVETNVIGTLNICEAAKKNECEHLIHTSTSEVYGTANYVPIDEKHPLQPQSPYSATKIGADALAMSYYNSFKLPLTVARPFNTYGPRQSARAVIPTMITQIANGAKEIKLGDVTPTRDFNYVEDTCSGFLSLLKNKETTIGQSINIGSNFEISIMDTLNLIKELMGSEVEFVVDPERIRPSGSEVFRLWCENKKIKELTNFEPQHSIKEGMKKTVDWFTDKENLKLYKSDIYNV